MHPGFFEIASKYQVPISERSCYNSFVWDGETLAINYQKENWDDDYLNLLSLSDPLPIPDNWMAHEIAHWVVADPTEREFPEYGCAIGVTPFGATGNIPWHTVGRDSKRLQFLNNLSDNVLSREEQGFRETCADFLGVYWCDLVGIPIEENARPINKIIASIDDPHSPYSVEEGWRVIIWLRERKLIP